MIQDDCQYRWERKRKKRIKKNLLQIAATDYIKAVPLKNFKAAWDAMDPEAEVSGSYGLDAVEGVSCFLRFSRL